jgi:hypothetical protein
MIKEMHLRFPRVQCAYCAVNALPQALSMARPSWSDVNRYLPLQLMLRTNNGAAQHQWEPLKF